MKPASRELEDPKICQVIKKDGRQCKNRALKGKNYCWTHRPAGQKWAAGFTAIATIIVLYTSVVINLDDVKNIFFPTKLPTPMPRADKLYFTFLIEASSRMLEPFDDTKTKWDSVREAAINNLIWGLPSRANFGLILMGGSTAGNTTNCDSVSMTIPIQPDMRDSIGDLIQSQEPQGTASLSKSIDLARDELLALADDSTVKDLELFVFLGGGDGCSNNDLGPLLYFLQNSSNYLSQTHVEIFVLSDEAIDQEILNQIEKSNQTAENIRVQITTNTQELTTAVSQSYLDAMDRAEEVEPLAVAAQETVVAQNPAFIQSVGMNAAPSTEVMNVNIATPVELSVTPSVAPTVSPTPTASFTPIPIPTTQVPPSPIPPTDMPPTAIPTVVILWDTTCPNNIYGAVRVQDFGEHYQVRDKASNAVIFTTEAQFQDNNDVKTCVFSGDGGRFAAAYHYASDTGGYTWVGVWSIASGNKVDETIIEGWQYDISGYFGGNP